MMAKKKLYKYYQPNDKDLKDKFGDCVIRALTKVLDKTWLETFDMVHPYEREEQCNLTGFTLDMYKRTYKQLGLEYHGIKVEKGSKRPTVESFTKEHPKGSYILRVAGHHVAAVNGNYYDTWDCGNKCLYGYFELVK